MIAAWILLQLGVDIRDATRLLIAWNVGAWACLLLITRMITDPRREASVWSRPEDENQWVLVVLGILASLAAMAAIVWELGPVKTMAGWQKAEAWLAAQQTRVLSRTRARLLDTAIREEREMSGPVSWTAAPSRSRSMTRY